MRTKPINPACSIKRQRRTRADIERLSSAIIEIGEQENPFTCRSLFYRMVSAGLINKTEADYNNVVIRLCSLLREDGRPPWSWITDGTRLMRKPESYSSLGEALETTKQCYRRSLWHEQDVYVEVWCEKDALTGMIYPVTSEWDVPLMVTRGFSSSTFLHGAAETIKEIGKHAYVYYLGDFDPSGLHIWTDIQTRLRRYARIDLAAGVTELFSGLAGGGIVAALSDDTPITFERIAITPEQVKKHNLPTRPTKRDEKNTHAKNFDGIGTRGESIEVDALPPRVLRRLVKNAIVKHINRRQLQITKLVEDQEREALDMMMATARRSELIE